MSEYDDARIRRAVKSALSDIVATTPLSNAPRLHLIDPQPGRPRRPLITLAAGLTAAAGIVGVVLVANRATDEPSSTGQTAAPHETPASTPVATRPATSSTATSATTSVPAVVGPGSTVGSSQPCGSATVPVGAGDVQTISGERSRSSRSQSWRWATARTRPASSATSRSR